MKYDELTERLINYFTSKKFERDVVAAKREFFDDAGIVDEENSHFEVRMNQFLDYYLFSRGLHAIQLTPAQYALQISEFKMSVEERPYFENLANVRHSLFEFIKVRGDDIHIRDLFSAEEQVIRNSQMRTGFNRDEIFDARLIPNGKELLFTKGFCFHPPEASKFILGEIKRLRKSDEEEKESLMLRLTKMRYKFDQYRHLKLEYVYTNERKVRF